MSAPIDRSKVADNRTNLMSARKMEARTPALGVEPPSRSEGRFTSASRAAMKVVRPVYQRATWYFVVIMSIVMVLWEIDDASKGTIYGWVSYVRENILKEVPLIPFALGVAARHYLFGDREKK
jgi:hypothetical protein